MQDRFHIGVVGAGGVANEHLERIAQCEGLKAIAVCDVNGESLRTTGDRYFIMEENRFRDYEDLINCREVDAVVVATPNYLHYPVAMSVIKAKKPFALEKPVGVTLNEAAEIRDRTVEAGIPNMVCFSYRFYPALRYAKTIAESGALGTIRHIYGQYIEGKAEDIPRFWRYEKSKAGFGTLGDIGSHLIDMARLMGGEFAEVSAQGGIIVKERPDPQGGGMLPVDVDDYFHFLAAMESGATATFACTKFAYGRKNSQRLEVYGSKGAFIYSQEYRRGEKLEVCVGDVYERTGDFTSVIIPEECRVSQAKAFRSILAGNDRQMAASVEDGYKAQQVMDALVTSAGEKQWVKIG